MMRDYSQLLSQVGQGQQNLIPGQTDIVNQPRRQRNRQRNRQQTQGQNLQGQSRGQQTQGKGFKKFTTRSLANTLGAVSETAKGLGIPKNVVHKIVDSAYRIGR